MEITTQCCWKFKVFWIFGNYHLCCWKCSKSQNFIYFLFLAECYFSTLINYSTNMCRASYEPTVNKNRNFLESFHEDIASCKINSKFLVGPSITTHITLSKCVYSQVFLHLRTIWNLKLREKYEASGLQLVHFLLRCADAVSKNKIETTTKKNWGVKFTCFPFQPKSLVFGIRSRTE